MSSENYECAVGERLKETIAFIDARLVSLCGARLEASLDETRSWIRSHDIEARLLETRAKCCELLVKIL